MTKCQAMSANACGCDAAAAPPTCRDVSGLARCLGDYARLLGERTLELDAASCPGLPFQDQLASLAEMMSAALFAARIGGDELSFVYASEKIADAIGPLPKDIGRIAELLFARCHPDDQPVMRACLTASARTLGPCSTEIRILHPGKGERQLEIKAVPQRQPDGTVLWIGMMSDVTDARKAARELDETNVRLLSVLRTIPDMVWLKDTAGTYTMCNHAFERLNCKTEAEIVGKTDFDLFEPELATFFVQKDREAIEAGKVCLNEEWVVYPDTGEHVLLETRKVPIFDSSGAAIGILGVARDITKRKHIEEMLAKREQEFRTLVEHSSDPILRYGPDLCCRYANPAAGALLRTQADTLLGIRPSQLPVRENGEIFERFLSDVLTTGGEQEFEAVWKDEAGNRFCHLVKLTPEFNTEGEVTSVLAVGRDISELHTSRQKIRQIAYYDQLTQLPNRALFNERLRRMISDAAISGRMAGVMVIDLDRFKTVNDTMGHPAGDALLHEVAQRLSSCVRAVDTVARLGGDEFAVLVPDIRCRNDLEQIAERILRKCDKRFVVQGKEVFVSCSVGIAMSPDHGTEPDELVQYADTALYSAKGDGRNAFRFYTKELTAHARERLMLELDLRHAVRRGEMCLHYQPKVCLKSGRRSGAEALLRWNHPRLGMMSPDRFMAVAEDTGLIVDIGAWVLREACFAAAEWNGPDRPVQKVAVNLSVRQFQTRGLLALAESVLEETGCRAEWIELEITESLLLEEDEHVLETLTALRKMGFTLAIDDFGTGYSALSYLTRFPIDVLKIDRSFVSRTTTDSRSTNLLKAILSLAHSLDLEVVAEGVETCEQAAILRNFHCQLAQGYLFSRPVAKDVLETLPDGFPLAS